MTDKELRKLSRTELLELLIEQGRENQVLHEALQAAHEALESRHIELQECGSIADAALHLTGVFQAAQQAADLYRENCERMYAERLAQLDAERAKCERECEAMRAEIKAKRAECSAACEAKIADADRKAAAILSKSASPQKKGKKGGKK